MRFVPQHSRSECVCLLQTGLSPRPTPHACGMAVTQSGRSFDTRRSAVPSRLAASRLAASPQGSLFTLGRAASSAIQPVGGVHRAGCRVPGRVDGLRHIPEDDLVGGVLRALLRRQRRIYGLDAPARVCELTPPRGA